MSDPAAPGTSPQRRSWIWSWPMALPLLTFAALAAIGCEANRATTISATGAT